jgi:hypothetical protein
MKMDEPVPERRRHREMNATLGSWIAGGDHHSTIGKHVLAQLAVEHELITCRLSQLWSRS